jgi:predicted phosphodiesterase
MQSYGFPVVSFPLDAAVPMLFPLRAPLAWFGLILFITLLLVAGCSPVERLVDEHPPSYYKVERQLPDSLSDTPTRFLVLGDTQAGWRAEHKFYRRQNWVTWKQLLFPVYQLYLLGNGILGAINWKLQRPDYGGSGRELMRAVLDRAMQDTDADFILHLGDMALHDGRRAGHWEGFLNEYKHSRTPLLEKYPVLPVIGNHEYANDSTGWANFEAVFDYPRFYVIDTPQAALFVVDSNYIVDQHQDLDDDEQDALFDRWFVSADSSEEASWLEQELKKREDRPYKIVAMHHPLVTFSWHEKDWFSRSNGPELPHKRNRLIALLQEYDVQVVLSGHEHLYEHNVVRYRYDDADRELHQVISSGGGVPPRRVARSDEFEERMARYEDWGLDVENLIQNARYHYTEVRATDDQLILDTYAVLDEDPERTERIERIAIPAPSRASTATR